MTKLLFPVAVTHIYHVEIDDEKLTPEFWEEFQGSITFYDSPREIAEHVAWNINMGGDDKFVEGIGPLAEMNIRVKEVDSNVVAERALDDGIFGEY